jgi:purine-binding chemotaxis protein CheW
MRTLMFRVGANAYSLDLEAVLEVVPMPSVTPLPTAPRLVEGLFNLRGQAVPVISSRLLFDTARSDAETHLIVVATSRGPAAIGTTEVPVIRDLGGQVQVEEAVVGSVHTHSDGVTVLIDPESLLVPRLRG